VLTSANFCFILILALGKYECQEVIILGERQEELLKEIVETYIQTFRPVGSSSLVDKFKVSSATIRNDMAYLESLGYLEKTHTSSGRIPSEAGYKYYVDNLMKPKELTGEEVLKLQTILNNKNFVIEGKCDNVIEAFKVKQKKYILGVQFHPEIMYFYDNNAKQLFNDFFKACSKK